MKLIKELPIAAGRAASAVLVDVFGLLVGITGLAAYPVLMFWRLFGKG